MAKWINHTASQKDMYEQWLAERPESVRKMVADHNLRFDVLYRRKSNDKRVILHALNEDGTVTVSVLCEYNPETMLPGGIFDRNVFGVDPADLEECDLPEGVIAIEGNDVDVESEEIQKEIKAPATARPACGICVSQGLN